MLLEHIIYSIAFALVIGLVFKHYTGKDPSWIIVVMALFPDIDFILQTSMRTIQSPFVIYHGDFHSILALVFFSLIAAWIVSHYNISFWHGFLCSALGMFAHYLEDYIAYPPAYAYFFPFSKIEYGIDLIPETRDLIFAGSEVLVIGMILLAGAILVRKCYDPEWAIDEYLNNVVHMIKQIGYTCKQVLEEKHVF